MIPEAKAGNVRAGFKQTMKAVSARCAKKVYIADDCDPQLSDRILSAAKGGKAEIIRIESMRELGKLCGIDIGASCAAVIC